MSERKLAVSISISWDANCSTVWNMFATHAFGSVTNISRKKKQLVLSPTVRKHFVKVTTHSDLH